MIQDGLHYNKDCDCDNCKLVIPTFKESTECHCWETEDGRVREVNIDKDGFCEHGAKVGNSEPTLRNYKFADAGEVGKTLDIKEAATLRWQEDWEDGFDNFYDSQEIGHKHTGNCEWQCALRGNLKQFIKDLLASRNAALLEYIEGQKKQPGEACPECQYAGNDTFNDALALIEKFIKDSE